MQCESGQIQMALSSILVVYMHKQLRSLQLLLPHRICSMLQLTPSHWVRFSCCPPIASTSAAAPQLHPLQLLLPSWVHFSCCSPTAFISAAALSSSTPKHPLAILGRTYRGHWPRTVVSQPLKQNALCTIHWRLQLELTRFAKCSARCMCTAAL